MLKGHVRAMTKFIQWNFIFPYEMANQRICNLRANAIQKFTQNPSQGTIYLFSKIQKWDLEHWFYFQESFVKTSEDDQELECEMYQTKYKVMIDCDMDWPP
jgi:hypothetical protein